MSRLGRQTAAASGGGPKPLVVALVVIAAGAALFLFKTRGGSHGDGSGAGKGDTVNGPIAAPKKAKTATPKPKQQPVGTAAELSAKLVVAEQQIGFQSMTLPSSGGKRKLEVRILPEDRCGFGDLDLIGLDLRGRDDGELLLTVEPIDPSGQSQFPPVTKKVRKSELSSGLTATMLLPETKAPTALGVYLCKDGAGRGSCRQKPLAETDKAQKMHMKAFSGEAVDVDSLFSDRIYVMHYLQLQAGAAAMLPERELDKEGLDRLDSYLGQRLGPNGAATSAHVQGALRTIAPVPAKAAGSTVVIKIPRASATACAGTDVPKVIKK